jgi:hypothetical protein
MPMLKARILLTSLLALFVLGCTEEKPQNPSTRTGSVGGVTSQDIDDLAKPDSGAKPK